MMKNIFFNIVKSKLAGNTSYLAEVICKNKKTLDIGCGFGLFLKNDIINFFGIDINQEALTYCRKKKYRVGYGTADSIPFLNNTFDRTVALHVIEHLPPDVAFKMLSEAYRVLKKGGLMAISTELATRTFWNTFSHIRPYPPKSLMKILTKREDHTYQETFIKNINFDIVGIYYNGPFFNNRLLTVFSQILANIFIFLARDYTIILKKN